jgi:TonB family protein
MFEDYSGRAMTTRSIASLLGSFAFHALLLVVLARAFAPSLVKISPVREGDRGTSIALLYWPARQAEATAGAADDRSPVPPQPAPAARRLTWNHPKTRKSRPTENTGPDVDRTRNQPTQARMAGSPYGSFPGGALTGADVRPAIRISGPNPVLSFDDLPNGMQGSVVVEVTIDERGNIIGATVLQSLAPAIDAKVLAAVHEWHFLPATRDGVAIASKQDVLYHFPR